MLVSSRPQPPSVHFSFLSAQLGPPQPPPLDAVPWTPTIALTSAPHPACGGAGGGRGGRPASPPTSPGAMQPSSLHRPVCPCLFPLQTRTSAPRITAAASKTASTPSAATSVSVAAASSSMTTSTTARKVSAARAPGHLPLPTGWGLKGSALPSPPASLWTQEAE